MSILIFPLELKIQADLSIVHPCACGWIFLNVGFNRVIGIDDVIIGAGRWGLIIDDVSFNRRHRRYGHLFQNRYKSILCEQDAYLKQLVGYIHLNPFRAGIVESVPALKTYPFTGHCALMGKKDILWQDTVYVLSLFDKTVTAAQKSYADYVSKCAVAGRRPELTGGGLIRSAGGWRAIRSAYEAGIRLTSDERILGSSSFVEKTLASAGEDYHRRLRLKTSGIDLDAVIEVVSGHLKVNTAELSGLSRRPEICQARALISF